MPYSSSCSSSLEILSVPNIYGYGSPELKHPYPSWCASSAVAARRVQAAIGNQCAGVCGWVAYPTPGCGIAVVEVEDMSLVLKTENHVLPCFEPTHDGHIIPSRIFT